MGRGAIGEGAQAADVAAGAGEKEASMDEQAAAAGIAPAAATEERVSTLLADRPCSKCLFNLVGQSIVRERRYGLLIVRCPECGTVASLQEYPLLGRWANRWAALSAAAWLLAAVAVTIGLAGVILGFTVGTMETTSMPLQRVIASAFEEHQKAQGVPVNQVSGWWNIDQSWWDVQDRRALIEAAGGLSKAIEWRGFVIWVIAFVVMFPLAAVWAVGAAHRRGWELALTYLPMLLIAAMFFSGAYLPGSRWRGASELAAQTLWPVTLPICLVLAVLPLAVGAAFGRPFARLLVRLWLPPRLRVPLSFLWICDGKPPPKPTW